MSFSIDYFNDVEGKIAYFEASRGCPYSCAYCMSGGDGLRCFTLERTFAELEKFKGSAISSKLSYSKLASGPPKTIIVCGFRFLISLLNSTTQFMLKI